MFFFYSQKFCFYKMIIKSGLMKYGEITFLITQKEKEIYNWWSKSE